MIRHLNDRDCPYPRLCAHRGYNTAAPDNTLPAFALALAMGAQEIEMDLWPTKDGELVACHDMKVDRTTNGTGRVCDMTYSELRKLDAGSWFSPAYKGVHIPLFEEVLDLLAGRVVLDIHIKSPPQEIAFTPCEEMRARGRQLSQWVRENANRALPITPKNGKVLPEMDYSQLTPYPEEHFETLLKLLDEFHCRDYAYICGDVDAMDTARRMAPDIARCNLTGHMNYTIIDHAIEYDCQKVTLTKGFVSQEMIDKAHAHGIRLNIFWADHPEEAQAYLDAGIDCVLTNNFQPVAAGVKL